MGKLHQLDHPVLQHKLSILRDKDTPSLEFRHAMREIAALLAYEGSRDLELQEKIVQTPMESTTVKRVADDVIVASVLRAGEGMLQGFLDVLPFASVGHVGIYRDKFLEATIEYYFKLPHESRGKRLFLIDPLVATGDTVMATLKRLKEYEVGSVKLMCILISPQALKRIEDAFPDVDVYTLSVERELNETGYLLPGVGDAGDRLFKLV